MILELDSVGEKFCFGVQISKLTSIIPAVEVDPAGCSYNPAAESHEVNEFSLKRSELVLSSYGADILN